MKHTHIIQDKRQLDALITRMRGAEVVRPLQIDVSLYDPSRSNEQNKKMWAMLTDIAKQVEWHGRKFSKDDWKDILTAAYKQKELVPGINGGFVMIGGHTHKYGVKEMIEFIELLEWFGAEHEVEWSGAKES